MDLAFWAKTDVGRVREHNEDNFLVDKRLNLYVVCDGMGGHAAGEVASAMSVNIVREVLRSHSEVFDDLERDPDSLAHRKSVLTLVEHAITEACARIYHTAQEDLSKKGMGTTCSLLLLAEGRGFIGHVGDSRIYLHRQGAIHQITEDHSLINEMIRLGKIKKGEEHNLPHKNAVTRAVGVNEFVEVDTWELDVFKGDTFLLCSDGLSGYFKDDSQILALVDHDDLQKVSEDCIDFANAGGGKDNITAILVRVNDTRKNSENIQRMMEVMRANSFFRYLNYKEMVQIVNLSENEEVATGEWIFEAGTDPQAMFLIVEGSVELVGKGVTMPLGPGEVAGEMAMIDETPQELGARALEDCDLLVIKRNRFMGLLRSDESLAVKLLWNFLQNWTFRLRKFPYEDQRGRRTDGVGAPTPPSSNLAFEDDRKQAGHRPSTVSGEFDEVDPSSDPEEGGPKSDPELVELSAPEEEPQPATVKSQPISPAGDKLDPNKTMPPSAASPYAERERKGADRGDLMKTIPAMPLTDRRRAAAALDPDKTVPDNGLGGLAWDDIIPPDLLEDEESLRETIQLDREDVEASAPDDDYRETLPSEAGNGLGKPISGESTTRSSTPQAQVLKRTKLVVGKDGEFDGKEHTRTRDVKPLRKKSDSTLELDIDDDNVEEVN